MPEVISKHPQVVKEVLESAGAKCGKGAPQKILTECPRESFCTLPGGEICVFGTNQIASMTQVERADLCPSSVGGSLTPGSIGLVVVAAVGTAWVMRRKP